MSIGLAYSQTFAYDESTGFVKRALGAAAVTSTAYIGTQLDHNLAHFLLTKRNGNEHKRVVHTRPLGHLRLVLKLVRIGQHTREDPAPHDPCRPLLPRILLALRLHIRKHIHPLPHLTEHHMLPIECRLPLQADAQLALLPRPTHDRDRTFHLLQLQALHFNCDALQRAHRPFCSDRKAFLDSHRARHERIRCRRLRSETASR